MKISDDYNYGLPRFVKILIAVAMFFLAFILSRTFLFTPFIVQDNSMNPGLKKGDYVIILKITKPLHNDIVLVKSPVEKEKVILKRIVAEGNDTVEMKNKKLLVNDSEYIPEGTLKSDKRIFPDDFSPRDNMAPVTLRSYEFFIMGDNFDYSFDSRQFGPVSRDMIIGKVLLKF